jgi:hypothetical protein
VADACTASEPHWMHIEIRHFALTNTAHPRPFRLNHSQSAQM